VPVTPPAFAPVRGGDPGAEPLARPDYLPPAGRVPPPLVPGSLPPTGPTALRLGPGPARAGAPTADRGRGTPAAEPAALVPSAPVLADADGAGAWGVPVAMANPAAPAGAALVGEALPAGETPARGAGEAADTPEQRGRPPSGWWYLPWCLAVVFWERLTATQPRPRPEPSLRATSDGGGTFAG
jgi:hypothetical protein